MVSIQSGSHFFRHDDFSAGLTCLDVPIGFWGGQCPGIEHRSMPAEFMANRAGQESSGHSVSGGFFCFVSWRNFP